MNIPEQILEMGRRAHRAARILATLPTNSKNRILTAMADAITQDGDAIIAANTRDMAAAKAAGLGGALLDRLLLDSARLGAMAEGLDRIAQLPDPVG